MSELNSEAQIIRVEGLHKQVDPGLGERRVHILRGVSFSVQRGEIFGFIGPNGAGKTTTLKVLMGLIRPDRGSASILGRDVSETEFRRQVGFLPEQPYFYDFLTGREILRYYAKLSGVARSARRQRIEELLDWVGLSYAADKRLRTYSKGMLQRIGIAQALIHDPAVVFLDEPMSGLDPIGRKDVRDLILRLRSEGKTVLINSHILADVEMICDRIAIIVKGEILYEGPVSGFVERGERPVDIVLASVGGELADDLVDHVAEHFGAELRSVGANLELRVAEKQVDPLLEYVLGRGAEVVSVVPYQQSLENLFISTMRETAK